MTARGTLGGHRKTRIYGRLDCPTALRAIAKGGYVKHRVFFADEAAAVAAGYRPCARCMPDRYREWKSRRRKCEKAIQRGGPRLSCGNT
ncbi:Ada metal-binding domain-containing protein [Mycolicibacterium agri]|nr:Ada metal-binding domain-containing protein [Mycolicibacterium agri]GFG55160.1 metal-binding protein [Mycolicibacterium agri]